MLKVEWILRCKLCDEHYQSQECDIVQQVPGFDLCSGCRAIAICMDPPPPDLDWTRAERKQKLSNLFAGVLIGLCLMAVILSCGWFLVNQ